MRYLSLLSGLFLFLLALGFAVKNSDLIVVRYYLGYQWQAPQSLVILTFFCAGAVVGVVASMSFLFRQRREILSLKREMRARTQAHESKDGS